MEDVKNIINGKGNVAILGATGTGKTCTLKSVLGYCTKENKKVLMIEDIKEYEKMTSELNGEYFIYDNIENIKYNDYLTTITFDCFKQERDNVKSIEILLKIIDSAIENMVEIIIIDEAYCYLNEGEKIFDRIKEEKIKLIISSQFDYLRNDKSEISFKCLFDTVILMLCGQYINAGYLQLLELYNIEEPKLVLDSMRSKKRGEAMTIRENKIDFKIA